MWLLLVLFLSSFSIGSTQHCDYLTFDSRYFNPGVVGLNFYFDELQGRILFFLPNSIYSGRFSSHISCDYCSRRGNNNVPQYEVDGGSCTAVLVPPVGAESYDPLQAERYTDFFGAKFRVTNTDALIYEANVLYAVADGAPQQYQADMMALLTRWNSYLNLGSNPRPNCWIGANPPFGVGCYPQVTQCGYWLVPNSVYDLGGAFPPLASAGGAG